MTISRYVPMKNPVGLAYAIRFVYGSDPRYTRSAPTFFDISDEVSDDISNKYDEAVKRWIKSNLLKFKKPPEFFEMEF